MRLYNAESCTPVTISEGSKRSSPRAIHAATLVSRPKSTVTVPKSKPEATHGKVMEGAQKFSSHKTSDTLDVEPKENESYYSYKIVRPKSRSQLESPNKKVSPQRITMNTTASLTATSSNESGIIPITTTRSSNSFLFDIDLLKKSASHKSPVYYEDEFSRTSSSTLSTRSILYQNHGTRINNVGGEGNDHAIDEIDWSASHYHHRPTSARVESQQTLIQQTGQNNSFRSNHEGDWYRTNKQDSPFLLEDHVRSQKIHAQQNNMDPHVEIDSSLYYCEVYQSDFNGPRLSNVAAKENTPLLLSDAAVLSSEKSQVVRAASHVDKRDYSTLSESFDFHGGARANPSNMMGSILSIPTDEDNIGDVSMNAVGSLENQIHNESQVTESCYRQKIESNEFNIVSLGRRPSTCRRPSQHHLTDEDFPYLSQDYGCGVFSRQQRSNFNHNEKANPIQNSVSTPSKNEVWHEPVVAGGVCYHQDAEREDAAIAYEARTEQEGSSTWIEFCNSGQDNPFNDVRSTISSPDITPTNRYDERTLVDHSSKRKNSHYALLSHSEEKVRDSIVHQQIVPLGGTPPPQRLPQGAPKGRSKDSTETISNSTRKFNTSYEPLGPLLEARYLQTIGLKEATDPRWAQVPKTNNTNILHKANHVKTIENEEYRALVSDCSKIVKTLKTGTPCAYFENVTIEKDGGDTDTLSFDDGVSSKRSQQHLQRSMTPAKKFATSKDNFRRTRVHWEGHDNVCKETIWAKIARDPDIESVQVDEHEFAKLFSEQISRNVEGTHNKRTEDFSRTVRIIDPKRAMNGGKILEKIDLSYHEIATAIETVDDSAMTTEQVEAIMPFLPTDKEKRDFLEYMRRDGTPLVAECEIFMAVIISVEEAKAKLEAILLMKKFPICAEDIRASCCLVRTACEEVRNSVRFRRILGIILQLGNCLNAAGLGGEYDEVRAVKVDSLIKMNQAITFDSSRTTFLQYVCNMIRRTNPSLLSYRDELMSLSKVEQVNWERVLKDLHNLEAQLNSVREFAISYGNSCSNGSRSNNCLGLQRNGNNNFHDHDVAILQSTSIGRFALDALLQMASLNALAENAKKAYQALLLYFGEEENCEMQRWQPAKEDNQPLQVGQEQQLENEQQFQEQEEHDDAAHPNKNDSENKYGNDMHGIVTPISSTSSNNENPTPRNFLQCLCIFCKDFDIALEQAYDKEKKSVLVREI